MPNATGCSSHNALSRTSSSPESHMKYRRRRRQVADESDIVGDRRTAV